MHAAPPTPTAAPTTTPATAPSTTHRLAATHKQGAERRLSDAFADAVRGASAPPPASRPLRRRRTNLSGDTTALISPARRLVLSTHWTQHATFVRRLGSHVVDVLVHFGIAITRLPRKFSVISRQRRLSGAHSSYQMKPHNPMGVSRSNLYCYDHQAKARTAAPYDVDSRRGGQYVTI